MTQIDGLSFTQLDNLNIQDNLYVAGAPMGGVTAPLTLDTSTDPLVSPLTLIGGSSASANDFDYINSGLTFSNADGNELWRLWASEPVDNSGNGANLYVGFEAGFSQPTVTENPAAGYWNVAIGFEAMRSLTEGNNCTAVGFRALTTVTTSVNNTAFGARALANATGESNTAVGHDALEAATTPNGNTAVGSAALSEITTGANNTGIGLEAGNNVESGSNNIFIGAGVQGSGTSASNELNIGDLIIGNLSTQLLNLNLPTTVQASGFLWADSGTVKVSP